MPGRGDNAVYEMARTGEAAESRTVSCFTDAAALRGPLGMPPTVILGPGEAAMAHQTDEYCRVAALVDVVGLYEDLVRDWCAEPARP